MACPTPRRKWSQLQWKARERSRRRATLPALPRNTEQKTAKGEKSHKKVTAFIGTASKKATYQAVQEFEQDLKQYGDIDFETVFLCDYRLELL
jgi:hypothetical protein